jgi:hypothetical protein
LSLEDMPDWNGLWTRIGNPFFDPEQTFSQLTTANLLPGPLAELQQRRALSAQGIEYDPISDCSPPGYPRWLAIPFLREFIVTPNQVWLTSETVNNIRRIYTDGRGHPPEGDAYPLWYGDSIGFWHRNTLVIHTSQVRENIFHRNDPRHSEPRNDTGRRLVVRRCDARRAVVRAADVQTRSESRRLSAHTVLALQRESEQRRHQDGSGHIAVR